MNVPALPILRFGQPYTSLDASAVNAIGTDDPVVSIGKANAGLVRRDARRFDEARAALAGFTCDELIDIASKAGDLFMNATLPLGDGEQPPADYVRQLSATTGLPHTLVRANMAKVHEVFTEMRTILSGLTRGLDLAAIDHGYGEQGGAPVSFYPTTRALGVVLPSNSPGVNSLWMPAIALKTPVMLKPGAEEPWTPYRIIQAFIAAGAPAEAFGFYPTGHDGSAAVMEVCDRSIIFGGADTVRKYEHDPSVEVHGPGWSKVIVGEDKVDHWQDYLDVIAHSIAGNSGRSCINASSVVVPRHGRVIAEALAEQLAEIAPRDLNDEQAKLSGFANPQMAEWMNGAIDDGLETPGAVDLSLAARSDGPRLVERGAVTYLQPTVVYCESADHPLANTEYMFPFASVVEVEQAEMLAHIGPSLVVSAITEDDTFIQQLLASPLIQRLNIGPAPTCVAQWDQPHEGNLFELLYQRRAVSRVTA